MVTKALAAVVAATITGTHASYWNGTAYSSERGANASQICTPTTVYVPFTATITSSAWSTSVITVIESSTASSDFTKTITVTATVSATPVLSPAVVSELTSTSIAPVSPPETTTSLPTTTTITSVTTITPTITAPGFTSSTFSLMSPDLTTTLTSTSYTTISLSAVSFSRAAFTGINTSGWNASSAASPQPLPGPTTSTMSNIVYFGDDNTTSSTTTIRITTTVGATITSIYTPPVFVTDISGSLTTISATPATVTYTVTGGSALTTSLSGASASSNEAGAAPNVPSAPAAYGLSPQSIFDATVPNSSTSTALQQASPSYTGAVTITSFVEGHGTTFIVESTPVGTTPMSPPPSNSTTVGASTSSLAFGPVASDTSSFSGSGSSASNFANSTVPSLVTVATSTLVASGSTTMLTVFSALPVQTASSSDISASTTRPPSIVSVVPSTISAETVTAVALGSTTRPFSPSSVESASQTLGPRISNTSSVPQPTSLQYESISHRPTSSTSRFTASATSSRATSTSPTLSSRPARTSSSSSFSNPFPATSATAIPSAGCGEQGNFTMTFDDLPTFHPTKRQVNNHTNGTDITQYPPLNLRPYRHMLFSQGYVYAPRTAEPFSPVSPPNVAAFVDPMKAGRPPVNSAVEPGEFGTYDDDKSAFYFDAKSAYLGCSNPGPDDCTIEATPYTYNTTIRDEVAGQAQNFTLSPCTQNCTLEMITFPPSGFKRLSGLQFRAIADSKPRMFFIDDMQMEWSDSSCEAGMTRQRTR